MKQAYTSQRFNRRSLELIDIINVILEDYEAQGYDLSLRQLYYQLVSRNIVENTERSYKNVGNVVSDGRLAGLIDWDMIVDRGRTCQRRSHWKSPADIVKTCANSYHIDMWRGQSNYVEVMVEKQALEGVLIPVCEAWDVPFTANKGYTSSSAIRTAAQRMLDAKDEGKLLYVIYLGDHDPSGIDMTRDIASRFDLFMGETWVDVIRVALNMDQVKRYNPPPNPAKLTDSRASAYIHKYGKKSWELDAIEPAELSLLVEDAIKSLIDMDDWRKMEKYREEERAILTSISDNFAKVEKYVSRLK